jgi:hypothetical protein
VAAAGGAGEIGERGVDGHFERRVAAWAADFQAAGAAIGAAAVEGSRCVVVVMRHEGLDTARGSARRAVVGAILAEARLGCGDRQLSEKADYVASFLRKLA